MPRTKFQEVIFTILMVFVMVYAMICYNIALSTGGLKNFIFPAAFKELIFMGPLAFVIDFFIVGPAAKMLTFRKFNPQNDNPFFIVLSISCASITMMCPLMSLAATIIFKHPGAEFLAAWIETTARNFPMAFFWQLFFAGPLVRAIFSLIFRNSGSEK